MVEENCSKKKKQPRRVLHFSDGSLEEYSTDEDEKVDSPEKKNKSALIDVVCNDYFCLF